MKSVGHRTYLAAALLGLVLSAPAWAEQPKVTVAGGMEPGGSYYKWEITNHSSSPVVSVEIPHYQADMFTPPPNWRSKSTYLVNVGVEDRPGSCRAFVDSPASGIPRGGKVSISMRVRQLESRQGLGIVKVGLADGTMLEIANVEVPCEPGYFERFGVLITLLIIIGLVALVAARRRRRQQAKALAATNRPEASQTG